MKTLTYDAAQADCRIFTFREGVLSAVAHDLELRVARLTLALEVDEDGAPRTLDVRCQSGSLQVVSAVRDGRPLPDALSASDRQKIERNLQKDVLHSERFAEVRFTAREIQPLPDGYLLRGRLSLHGHERPWQVTTRRDGDQLVAEFTINQPDFAIIPYSAMLGTLRVRPEVRVRLTLPWPERS